MPKSYGWCIEDSIIWTTLCTLGICVQNYSAIIWGEEIRKEIFYVSNDSLFFPSLPQFYQNSDRKALPACPTKSIGSSYLKCHRTILSGHMTLASQCVIWKCEEEKNAVLKPPRICLQAQIILCVCVGWGLESGCHFVVDLFLFLNVKIAQRWCPTKKDSVSIGSGHT